MKAKDTNERVEEKRSEQRQNSKEKRVEAPNDKTKAFINTFYGNNWF